MVRMVVRRDKVSLTVHVASNISCYMCAAGNPESGVGKGAEQTRVKTRCTNEIFLIFMRIVHNLHSYIILFMCGNYYMLNVYLLIF